MLAQNEIVDLDSGGQARAERLLGRGGGGTAFLATDLATGKKAVLKEAHEITPEGAKRLRHLVAHSRDIQTACIALYSPYDCLTSGSLVSLSPFAPGQTLESLLAAYDATFVEALQLSLAISHLVCCLHRLRIVHGDLHPGNVLVIREGNVLKCYLIDFENFTHSGVPRPPLLGRIDYLAPELFKALSQGQPAVPDIASELFSLGVMFHEILLVKHPTAGRDRTEKEHEKALNSGWIHDPARADRVSGQTPGFPSSVLDMSLMRLFRRSLSVDPKERVSAADWVDAFTRLLYPSPRIEQCDACQGPYVIEASRFMCPSCGYSTLLKLVGTFGGLELRQGITYIGRGNLGGSQSVSDRHAVIRRHGSIYTLQNLGRNGTYRWDGGWVAITDQYAIRKGDRLLFANVEARVAQL